eukprot:TRINITY_DN27409_c0_g1_i1.p1 TRINITY_DN27409_c0_g1~~TRINITY_DN27409_c0_g1_i1.p1  ORF type:complete len:211 (+),score=31.53 TRINITY_DN27409_c0_g1_i1:111-743(+)
MQETPLNSLAGLLLSAVSSGSGILAGIAGLIPAAFVVAYVVGVWIKSDTVYRGGLTSLVSRFFDVCLLLIAAAFPLTCALVGAEVEGASTFMPGSPFASSKVVGSTHARLLQGLEAPSSLMLMLQLHFALLAVGLAFWSSSRVLPWELGSAFQAAAREVQSSVHECNSISTSSRSSESPLEGARAIPRTGESAKELQRRRLQSNAEPLLK